jgi:queuine tRNA-ribosyltransferase
MLSVSSNWVPVLTSEAGLCLTAENWQEAQINSAVYYLDSLLLKPGASVLNDVSDFSFYINWPGQIIINASCLKANKEGVITLVSPYDGSKTRLNYVQLIDLIHHLKPQIVILPPDITKEFAQLWDLWPQDIMPYLSSNDLVVDSLPIRYGVYFALADYSAQAKAQLQNYKHLPRYVQGNFTIDKMRELILLGINFLESDEPSRMGMQGFAYEMGNIIDLKGEGYASDFELLGEQCLCPTCSAHLTKAYLHHLFLHTPLLCQRFLIQHNAWYVQSFLRK